MHTAAIAPSCTQNTGAPINKSRTLPPPTPVTSAKKAAVTSVWRKRTAISAPDNAKTPMPTRSSRRTSSWGSINTSYTPPNPRHRERRSEEHTSELQSLMRISYAVFCLKKKKPTNKEPKSYLNNRSTMLNTMGIGVTDKQPQTATELSTSPIYYPPTHTL